MDDVDSTPHRPTAGSAGQDPLVGADPDGDLILNVRHPALAFLYRAAKPLLVTPAGERRLAWGANLVDSDELAEGFRLEVAYFGFRIGKATYEGTPEPGTVVNYRAPHVTWAPGSVGATAKSHGAGWLAVLLALPIAAMVALAAVVLYPQLAPEPEVADPTWVCPSVDEVVATVGPAASGLAAHAWNARETGLDANQVSMTCAYVYPPEDDYLKASIHLGKDNYDGSSAAKRIDSLDDWLYSYGPLSPTTYQRVPMDGVDDAAVARLKSGWTNLVAIRGTTVIDLAVDDRLATVEDTDVLFALMRPLLSAE